MNIDREHFRGTFIGGAVADALAYNTKSGGLSLISDNTQMAAFTADGLIWALEKAKNKGVYAYIPCLFYAYQKWYYTQTGSIADKSYSFIRKGEILKWEELYARRGEGMTTLKALEGSLHNMYGTLKNRVNNSNGCGGVMRVAPVGMCFCYDEKTAFKIGCESAALTHGHMGGIVPAGYVAAVISLVLQGYEIFDAIEKILKMMERMTENQDSSSTNSIKRAIELAQSDKDAITASSALGEGYTGEELVALAVYCLLKFNGETESTLEFASRYGGNKFSLATICGNILGAYHGVSAIPFEWINKLELLELLIYIADKLLDGVTTKVDLPRAATAQNNEAVEVMADDMIPVPGVSLEVFGMSGEATVR